MVQDLSAIGAILQRGGAVGLSAQALHFLSVVWDICQAADDIHDGDKPRNVGAFLENALINLHECVFYRRYRRELTSAIRVALLKWEAANLVEKHGLHDEKSYMWRAGFYDVMLLCYALEAKNMPNDERKSDAALYILATYGEKYTNYYKEFSQEGGTCQTP